MDGLLLTVRCPPVTLPLCYPAPLLPGSLLQEANHGLCLVENKLIIIGLTSHKFRVGVVLFSSHCFHVVRQTCKFLRVDNFFGTIILPALPHFQLCSAYYNTSHKPSPSSLFFAALFLLSLQFFPPKCFHKKT